MLRLKHMSDSVVVSQLGQWYMGTFAHTVTCHMQSLSISAHFELCENQHESMEQACCD